MTACNFSGHARTAVLVLCAIGGGIVALGDAHLIGPASTARLVGVVIGATAVVAGIFSRKMRPLECSDAVGTAVVGFLMLCAIAGAITVLAGTHVIGPASAARGLGIVVGAMAILTGNFLPKARPLETAADVGPQTRAAERAIGWILVLAGVAFVVLFVFAPLARAKSLGAAAGIGALLLIGATSVRVVGAAVLRRRAGALTRNDLIERSAPGASGHRRMLALLVSVLYVLATACTQYLFAGRPLGHAIASWMQVAFVTGFAVFLALRGRGWERLG
jgi:hypothetical protein